MIRNLAARPIKWNPRALKDLLWSSFVFTFFFFGYRYVDFRNTARRFYFVFRWFFKGKIFIFNLQSLVFGDYVSVIIFTSVVISMQSIFLVVCICCVFPTSAMHVSHPKLLLLLHVYVFFPLVLVCFVCFKFAGVDTLADVLTRKTQRIYLLLILSPRFFWLTLLWIFLSFYVFLPVCFLCTRFIGI